MGWHGEDTHVRYIYVSIDTIKLYTVAHGHKVR